MTESKLESGNGSCVATPHRRLNCGPNVAAQSFGLAAANGVGDKSGGAAEGAQDKERRLDQESVTALLKLRNNRVVELNE